MQMECSQNGFIRISKQVLASVRWDIVLVMDGNLFSIEMSKIGRCFRWDVEISRVSVLCEKLKLPLISTEEGYFFIYKSIFPLRLIIFFTKF